MPGPGLRAEGGGHVRDKSPSIKRKMDDGSAVEVDRQERTNNRAAQRKCVVGTANNIVQVYRSAGRFLVMGWESAHHYISLIKCILQSIKG